MDILRNQRVLICNDDGIDAHGIKILEGFVRPHAKETWVVAPAAEQSGAATSAWICWVSDSEPKVRMLWISEAQSTSCFLNWRQTKVRTSRCSGTC